VVLRSLLLALPHAGVKPKTLLSFLSNYREITGDLHWFNYRFRSFFFFSSKVEAMFGSLIFFRHCLLHFGEKFLFLKKNSTYIVIKICKNGCGDGLSIFYGFF
jgi:hypothetical protein